jgi:hypothetical protein
MARRIDSKIETRRDLDNIRQHMGYLARMDSLRDVPDDLPWLDDGELAGNSAH